MLLSPAGTAHEPYLHLNLVSRHLFDQGTPPSHRRTPETVGLGRWRGPEPPLRCAGGRWDGKPCSHITSPARPSCGGRGRAEAEIEFIALAATKRNLDGMAERLRRFFCECFERGRRQALHPEPARASSAAQLRRRASRLADQVRRCLQ